MVRLESRLQTVLQVFIYLSADGEWKVKKVLVPTLGLLVLALACGGVVWADTLTDPATLHVGAVPSNGTSDPVQIAAGDFTITQTSGGAGSIANLFIYFAVPNVTTSSNPISGLSIISGTGTISYLTNGSSSLLNTMVSTGCTYVYDCVGFAGASGIDKSNSFVNFTGADSNLVGITASDYGIYGVEITGANISQGIGIELGGNMPIGTFIDPLGVSGGDLYVTAFTNAGLNVPEPSSLVMLFAGLLGLALLAGRRVLTA